MTEDTNVQDLRTNSFDPLKSIKEGKKKEKRQEVEKAAKELIAAYDTFKATETKYQALVKEFNAIENLTLPQ